MAQSIFEQVTAQVYQQQKARVEAIPVVAKHLPLARALRGGDAVGTVQEAIRLLLDDDKPGRDSGASAGAGGAKPPTIPLLGGITFKRAREIFEQYRATQFAKKNLWFLRIGDIKPKPQGAGQPPLDINLFATDVSYSPVTITGDTVKIGSAQVDNVQGSERVEIKVTTMDDITGAVKRWFEERASRVAHADGTFGLPIDYLMRAEITHACIGPEADGFQVAKTDKFIVRPGSMDYEKSRRDDALEEISFTLVQFDTFTIIN